MKRIHLLMALAAFALALPLAATSAKRPGHIDLPNGWHYAAGHLACESAVYPTPPVKSPPFSIPRLRDPRHAKVQNFTDL